MLWSVVIFFLHLNKMRMTLAHQMLFDMMERNVFCGLIGLVNRCQTF